jgi:hypothetical protein
MMKKLTRKKIMLTAVLILFHVLGFISSIHAVIGTRTSPIL